MNHKNFANRRLFKRNYYAVSIDPNSWNLVRKLNDDEITKIKNEGKCEFTMTYDHYDHTYEFPCKIIVEEIETNKRYFDL